MRSEYDNINKIINFISIIKNKGSLFFILKYLWCAVMPKLHGLNEFILHFVAVLIFFCSPLRFDPVITQKSWSPFHVPYLATYCFILWFFFGLLQGSFDSLYILRIVHYKQQCPSFDLHEEKKIYRFFSYCLQCQIVHAIEVLQISYERFWAMKRETYEQRRFSLPH